MDWHRIPPLASLRAFEAAARHLSHSAAARELGVTHAAIAQQVRALEAYLGLPLLYREGRGLALTDDGATLATSLTGGFGQIAQAVELLADSEAARPLHISMTPSFAVSWFMPRMHEFRRLHPEIELSINPTSKNIDLVAERFDAAIRFGDGNWPGLESEPLVVSDFVIACAPSVIQGHEITGPESLLALQWLQEVGTDEIGRWLASRGIAMPPVARISEMPGYMMLSALREGHGVAATARLFIEDDIAAGRLVVLFEEAEGSRKIYHLVTRPGVPRPALKKFISWIKRAAA
ncbi:LysR family transcriptional regulator [Rhodobacteraceae bacterium NNCM2]|nr:LysR family transcriptional regulator [Coraliihabitans acroporae]